MSQDLAVTQARKEGLGLCLYYFLFLAARPGTGQTPAFPLDW